MTYKERMHEALIKSRDELISRIKSLPIYERDISIGSTQITFAVSEVVEKLSAVDWAEPAEFKSIEQVAAERIQKQTPEPAEVSTV